jgi:hypothetical protein
MLGQVMWDLRHTKQQWGQVFSKYFSFPCEFSVHKLLYTHLLSYNQQYKYLGEGEAWSWRQRLQNFAFFLRLGRKNDQRKFFHCRKELQLGNFVGKKLTVVTQSSHSELWVLEYLCWCQLVKNVITLVTDGEIFEQSRLCSRKII